MDSISKYSGYSLKHIALGMKRNGVKKDIQRNMGKYKKSKAPVHVEQIKKQLSKLLNERKTINILPDEIKDSNEFKSIHRAVTEFYENKK